MVPRLVLAQFGIDEPLLHSFPIGDGLIHKTYKIEMPGRSFILQEINADVFKEPFKIADNTGRIAKYLKEKFPDYLFVTPCKTIDGNEILQTGTQYYRLTPFVEKSHTINVVSSASQAYEAAKQFGKFTHLLSGFPAEQLHQTIPSFHDLDLRYTQFTDSIVNGNRRRVLDAEALVKKIRSYSAIVDQYQSIRSNDEFKIRVMHHDCKISNVLFDEQEKGLCVIDLDTVMPGYFFSDVGDMMRTYLSPVSEEETDESGVVVRNEIYMAITEGYLSEMQGDLTGMEKKYFLYAGKMMIYMQALRFLTDHFNNDQYYGSRYVGHNLARAKNQLTLLDRLVEKEDELLSLGL